MVFSCSQVCVENVIGGFSAAHGEGNFDEERVSFSTLNFTAPGNGPQTRLGHKLLGAGQRFKNYTVKHTASASEA